jgi:hypothetical protein
MRAPLTHAAPLARAQNFMYQLCIGIAHLHRHGVMHRREPREPRGGCASRQQR